MIPPGGAGFAVYGAKVRVDGMHRHVQAAGDVFGRLAYAKLLKDAAFSLADVVPVAERREQEVAARCLQDDRHVAGMAIEELAVHGDPAAKSGGGRADQRRLGGRIVSDVHGNLGRERCV
jgi:hypothetical protein